MQKYSWIILWMVILETDAKATLYYPSPLFYEYFPFQTLGLRDGQHFMLGLKHYNEIDGLHSINAAYTNTGELHQHHLRFAYEGLSKWFNSRLSYSFSRSINEQLIITAGISLIGLHKRQLYHHYRPNAILSLKYNKGPIHASYSFNPANLLIKQAAPSDQWLFLLDTKQSVCFYILYSGQDNDKLNLQTGVTYRHNADLAFSFHSRIDISDLHIGIRYRIGKSSIELINGFQAYLGYQTQLNFQYAIPD